MDDWNENEYVGGLGHFAPYGNQEGMEHADRRLIGFRHDYRPTVREFRSRAPILE